MISYSSAISRSNLPEALKLLAEVVEASIEPDAITVATLIHSCRTSSLDDSDKYVTINVGTF